VTTFWTADHHFNHKNIIEYTNRPFIDLTEMHRIFITNWNKVVQTTDLVYYLGDFSFGGKQTIRKVREQLNGKIILIKGNHDRINNSNCGTFEKVYRYQRQPVIIRNKRTGYMIAMSHCKQKSYKLDDNVDLRLHGHSHGEGNGYHNTFDVGIDNCPNFAPVTLEQILTLMKERN